MSAGETRSIRKRDGMYCVKNGLIEKGVDDSTTTNDRNNGRRHIVLTPGSMEKAKEDDDT